MYSVDPHPTPRIAFPEAFCAFSPLVSCGYGLPNLFGMFAVMRGIVFQDAEHTVLLVANRLETVEVILGNVANRIQECLPRAVQSPCCFSSCCHLTSILTASAGRAPLLQPEVSNVLRAVVKSHHELTTRAGPSSACLPDVNVLIRDWVVGETA